MKPNQFIIAKKCAPVISDSMPVLNEPQCNWTQILF